MSSSRNLWLLAALACTGCGFSPLYGDSGSATSVQQQMDEVSVANIPDRSGQVLRQSLADQMQTAGAPTQEIFLLSVSYNIAVQGVGLQQDTSSTRNRFIATANWTLAPIGSPHLPLTQGQASTEDALNIIDQQYFASALETNTIDRQLADEIATQISAQVAAYFKTHPTAG